MASVRRYGAAVAIAAAALLLGCANQASERPAAPKAAGAPPRYVPPEDPYPSTYHPYPGAPTAITGATVYDGEGGRIENGTWSWSTAASRRSAGRTRRSPRARPGSTATAFG